MAKFNDIQQLKRDFFSLRNGIIADTMRKAGSPYKIIFGLNLPQLTDLAKQIGKDAEMARKLWANTTTRESMLIAPMIFPVEEMTETEAQQWLSSAISVEAIDILCHKLLRHTPFAYELACRMSSSSETMLRYAALRLFWPFLTQHADVIYDIATAEAMLSTPLTLAPARQIIDEIEFRREG